MVSDLILLYRWNKSSALLLGFIEIYLRYMVSYKRLSRTEIIKALSHVLEVEEKSKMMTDLS